SLLMSGISRPSNVFTISMSFERPASMRDVHQAPPAVEISETRSPSRVPFSRKLTTAAFAWLARHGVVCMSSNTITKVRPCCVSLSTFDVILGGGGAAPEGCSGSSTASKLTTSCLTPSSVTVMSLDFRPWIGTPFLSVTTTSTTTCSSWVGKLGVAAVACPAGAACAGVAGVGAACGLEAGGFSCAPRTTASARLSSTGAANRLFICSFHLHEDAPVFHLHVVARDLERSVHDVLSGPHVEGVVVRRAANLGALHEALAERSAPVGADVGQGVESPADVEQSNR